MTKQRFASVWDAIEDTPEQAEDMKLRSAVMTALQEHLARAGLSKVRAAEVLGVTQLRVSDLVGGKINLFPLGALVDMASAAGVRVQRLEH